MLSTLFPLILSCLLSNATGNLPLTLLLMDIAGLELGLFNFLTTIVEAPAAKVLSIWLARGFVMARQKNSSRPC
jgi:hypothetical protein